ncbi:BlaI/MecI/CopY family transcriptional regulator [Thermoflexibacter ruber]|uniref:Predicted transcriptional regulator n=1 Tax=Thermoflexibacter ruber TaxID=1003 RepID=A0A1I2KDH8_9BACT|nr:BlaI/MecI/CopY family transcriptional regulator [Thermoflexibacter ruber]SFF63151.1 Predicted transcriptional regulator [Thermoflexibacter ruber]
MTKPTDSELEILQILWQKGSCTVREVNEILNQSREGEVGYTTTLKIMQIMHEKGLIGRDDSAKTHIYSAVVKEEDTQKQLLERFMDSVFKGSAMKMVMQALGNQKTTPEELAEIKKLIEEMENKK